MYSVRKTCFAILAGLFLLCTITLTALGGMFAASAALDAGVLETFSSEPTSAKVPWGTGSDNSEARPAFAEDENGAADGAWKFGNTSNGEMNVWAEQGVDPVAGGYDALQLTVYFDKLPVGTGADGRWDTFEVKLCTDDLYSVGYWFALVFNEGTNRITKVGWQTIVIPLEDLDVRGEYAGGAIDRFYMKAYCVQNEDIRISDMRFVKTEPSPVFESFSSEPNAAKVPWGTGNTADQLQPVSAADENETEGEAWRLSNLASTAEMNVVAEQGIDPAASGYDALQLTMYFDKMPVGDGGAWDTFCVKLAGDGNYAVGYEFWLVSTTINRVQKEGWQTIVIPLSDLTPIGGYTEGKLDRFYMRAYCTTHTDIRISDIRFLKETTEPEANPVLDSFSQEPTKEKVPWGTGKTNSELQPVLAADENGTENGAWSLTNRANSAEMNVIAENPVDPALYDSVQLTVYFDKIPTNLAEPWDSFYVKLATDETYGVGYEFYLFYNAGNLVTATGWQTISVPIRNMTAIGGYDGGPIDRFYIRALCSTMGDVRISEIRFTERESTPEMTVASEADWKIALGDSNVTDITISGKVTLTEPYTLGRAVHISGEEGAVLSLQGGTVAAENMFDFAQLKSAAALTVGADVSMQNLQIRGGGALGLFVAGGAQLTAENVSVQGFTVCAMGIEGKAALTNSALGGGRYAYFCSESADCSGLPENVYSASFTVHALGEVGLQDALACGNMAVTVESAMLGDTDVTDSIADGKLNVGSVGEYAVEGAIAAAGYRAIPFSLKVIAADNAKPVIALAQNIPDPVQGEEYDLRKIFDVSDNMTDEGALLVEWAVRRNYAEISVQGHSLVLEKAGDYTVLVIVTDASGNFDSMEYDFTVADTHKPVFGGLDSVPDTVKAGDTVDLSGIFAEDETAGRVEITLTVTKGGKEVALENGGFVAEEGEYVVSVSASDGVNTATEQRTVRAEAAGGCKNSMAPSVNAAAAVAIVAAAACLTGFAGKKRKTQN